MEPANVPWDAVCGKKACNVFLATVGFLLKLMFALGLLSNTDWPKWKQFRVS